MNRHAKASLAGGIVDGGRSSRFLAPARPSLRRICLTASLALACFLIVSVPTASASAGITARHYELVSPPAKNSSIIFEGMIAPDGQRVVINSGSGLDGGGLKSPTLGIRNPDGSWQTRSLLPPSEQRPYPNYMLTANNQAFTRFFALAASSLFGGRAPAATVTIDDHANQTIHASYNAEISSAFTSMIASDDLTKVYANVRQPNDPDHVPGTSNIYDVAQDPPVLISRLPDGAVPTCGVDSSQVPGFALSNLGHTFTQRWVSSDGKRIFFFSMGNGPCDFSVNSPTLYRRDLNTNTTTLISGPALNTPKPFTSFLQANADGSTAFFATLDALTPDDTDDTGDIYRWDQPNTLTCITCTATVDVTDSNGAYDTTAAVSQDLSHAYFVSGDSIYVWHVTQTSGPAGTIDPIATGLEGVSVVNNPVRGGQLTPDGSVLLYTAGPQDAPQLYRYDDRDGSSRCLSCPQSGPPTSHALLPTAHAVFTGYQHVMSDDGSRVFFGTSGTLSADDTDNGGPSLYEWHDDGSAQGEYGVIADDANILDVSADGSEVLFVSYAALTSDVEDSSNQAYVAKLGPAPPKAPHTTTPPCEGDGCQGPISAAPADFTAASSTFIGPPSPKARRSAKKPRCGKNKHRVRRNGKGRCVRKRGHGATPRANNNRRTHR